MTETDMTIATRAKRGAEMAGGPATLNSRAPGWFVGGLRCTHVSSHSRRLRLCGEEKSHSKPAAGVDETLAFHNSPEARSTSVTSVNVPPVSTATDRSRAELLSPFIADPNQVLPSKLLKF